MENSQKTGPEIYAYFQIGNNQFIARLEVSANIIQGKEIDLHFDLDKIFFFDKESEKIIN